MGVQVHGGMGFIEETGAAQFARDVRVTAIYEGTNGIQAMDLVGRKMMDGGEAAYRLIDEVQASAEAARSIHPDLASAVWNAAEALREATEGLIAHADERPFRRGRALSAGLCAGAGRAFPPESRACRSGTAALGAIRDPAAVAGTCARSWRRSVKVRLGFMP